MDCYCGLSHWSVAQPTANDDCFIFWGPYFESLTGLKARPYAIGGPITWFWHYRWFLNTATFSFCSSYSFSLFYRDFVPLLKILTIVMNQTFPKLETWESQRNSILLSKGQQVKLWMALELMATS